MKFKELMETVGGQVKILVFDYEGQVGDIMAKDFIGKQNPYPGYCKPTYEELGKAKVLVVYPMEHRVLKVQVGERF